MDAVTENLAEKILPEVMRMDPISDPEKEFKRLEWLRDQLQLATGLTVEEIVDVLNSAVIKPEIPPVKGEKGPTKSYF